MKAPAEILLRPLAPRVTPSFGLQHAYVEIVYAPLLGPTATLLAKGLARRLEGSVGHALVSADELAREIGVRAGIGQRSPLHNAISRLEHSGIVEWIEDSTLGVRLGVPPLGSRLLKRLPSTAQRAHRALVALLEQSPEE